MQGGNPKKRPKNVSELTIINSVLGQNGDWRELDASVWWAGLAPILRVASAILVNGLFVPIAEEYLWRGLVQPRLIRVLPIPHAIGLTAVLFSLKHVIVDASLGRLLALTAFGIICGVVAHRDSWRRSAALHMVANTVVTVIGLALGLT